MSFNISNLGIFRPSTNYIGSAEKHFGSCRQIGEAMTPGKVAPGGTPALAPAKTAHQGVSTAAAPVLPDRISPVCRHEPKLLFDAAME